jgi:hypothetical protein
VNVALTPTQTLGIPYILPGLLVLVALIGVSTSFCFKTCPRFSACCIASVTLVTLPVLFVLVGGGLFPALIVTSDVCSSGANVGHTFVANSPKTVCSAVRMEYTALSGERKRVFSFSCALITSSCELIVFRALGLQLTPVSATVSC